MKIEILQEEPNKGLSIVTRAVASRPQLAVLSNVLLEAHKDGIVLSSTDLELGISIKLNAKVLEEGVATVPAKTLYEFVGSLAPGKVSLTLDKESLQLVAGSYKSKFQTISADEFPRLPEFVEEKSIAVNCEAFALASSMVMFACARDSLRPVLTGVLLEVGKKSLNVVATDGFRLAHRKVSGTAYDGDPFTLLVPMRAISEVTRLEGVESIEISHVEKTHQVMFRGGGTRVVTQIIDGNYPDYNKIVPKEFLSEAMLSREELLQAVKATHIFARENSNMMRWQLEDGEMVIRAESPERGESLVGVGMKMEGDGGEVVFNTKFVLDFLQVSKASTIRFGMGEKLAPCAFREEGNEDMLYVVMPINA